MHKHKHSIIWAFMVLTSPLWLRKGGPGQQRPSKARYSRFGGMVALVLIESNPALQLNVVNLLVDRVRVIIAGYAYPPQAFD